MKGEKEGQISQIVNSHLALNKSTCIPRGEKKDNIFDECQMNRGNRCLLCRIESFLAIEQFFIGAVDD